MNVSTARRGLRLGATVALATIQHRGALGCDPRTPRVPPPRPPAKGIESVPLPQGDAGKLSRMKP